MNQNATQQSANQQTIQSTQYVDERLLDAKLEAVEARTQTKFAELMGELKVIAANVGNLGSELGAIKASIGTLDTKVDGVQSATAGVKWNILAAGLALGGLILAIAAFGTQILELAIGLVGAGK